jgi:hypothetical protein
MAVTTFLCEYLIEGVLPFTWKMFSGSSLFNHGFTPRDTPVAVPLVLSTNCQGAPYGDLCFPYF